MKKYTANYAYTNPNFVIQNLVTDRENTDLLPILCVLKNILQRGFPTMLSKHLQGALGEIHKMDNFGERFLFATSQPAVWNDTIKGDSDRNYYPARDFFENIVPNTFGEYAFVQSLLLPEAEIEEITGENKEAFAQQQVDFYLPQAKLVIEIDGRQHRLDEVVRVADGQRDSYLFSKGITTIRITTEELQNGTYAEKTESILKHLGRHEKLLRFYKKAHEKTEGGQISEEETRTKLLPTAIIRFQILLIELLAHGHLSVDEDWNFNILAHEELPGFAELAATDLLIWLDNLWQLKNKQVLKKPNFTIEVTSDKEGFRPTKKAINVDFSLFKRYTDENRANGDIIFVRTDYFDLVKDKNYFRASTTDPICYNITDGDKETLRFFLRNIFDKEDFREGQLPIIFNVLNRKDTIGLLPTGGGKSLCYQLPCLLQPSISFVVCPIKSLMYDQNDSMAKALITNVNFITGDQKADEKEEVLNDFAQGKYLFVWISPERFQTPKFRDKIRAIVANHSIAHAVVDEVHCLSEWGHDFRTSYLNLARTIDALSPKDENDEGKITFIGLTATASVNVLKDIKVEFSRQKQSLEEDNIKSLLDYSREELRFEVVNDNGNKYRTLSALLDELKDQEGFTENDEKAGLIFTPYVNGPYGCYQVSNTLNGIFQKKTAWYAGSSPTVRTDKGKKNIMDDEALNKYRVSIQKDFKDNKYPLLVATKAFGMGIDKPNIHYTFHFGLPGSVEALYQEAGRAGRWDKRKAENKGKIGKCYVLHSHEVCERTKIERLFQKDTTFSEIRKIQEEVRKERIDKDVFRQIFLFVQGHNDIEKDLEIVLGVIENYFKESTRVRIYWNDARAKLKIDADVLQKAIYRLSLLGIASDWTTDFVNHYAVDFETLDEENIVRKLSEYITKYEPGADVVREIQKAGKETVLEKAVWYLLNWTFENVAYSRKQSLKTLSDWCSEFRDSESFKQRIDSYFKFTETTFVLQHIAENPSDYGKWFEVLMPNNRFPERAAFEKLKDSISRFLESYRNSAGLNFLSGFTRLSLDDYEDSDGKERFESALSSIKGTFARKSQHDFLDRAKILGTNLSEGQKVAFVRSISSYYPEMLEELAEYYGLPYVLNGLYEEKLGKFKQLNKKLYEQLAEI